MHRQNSIRPIAALALVVVFVIGCTSGDEDPDRPMTTDEGHLLYKERLTDGKIHTLIDLTEGYSAPPPICDRYATALRLRTKQLKSITQICVGLLDMAKAMRKVGLSLEPVNDFFADYNSVKAGLNDALASMLELRETHGPEHWIHVEGNTWELKRSGCGQTNFPDDLKTKFEYWFNMALEKSRRAQAAVQELRVEMKRELARRG